MKYSFVVSCSYDYLFGLNATMNAAKFFGTDAEFSIAYDDSISKEVRDSYIDAFPFKINWYSLDNLLKAAYLDKYHMMNKFWIAPWLLATNIVEDYDSICILQADEFLVTNVNNLFRTAALADIVIATEWTCSSLEFEDLEFGQPQASDDPGTIILFDQLVFCNKVNRDILFETHVQQSVPLNKEITQVNHPMSSLCRACRKHLSKDKVMGLDGHTWCWDRDEWDFKLDYDWKSNKFSNERKIKVNGIHTRAWQEGLVQCAVDKYRDAGESARKQYEIGTHNFNLVKDVMVYFNDMTPATKHEGYYKERYI